MKILGVMNLLAAVIMVALAVVLPLAFGIKNVGMIVGLSVGAFVCFIVGAFLMGSGSKVLGDEEVLKTGIPTTAVIKAVRETGISLNNDRYLILEFNLEVKEGSGSTYLATCRSKVPRLSMGMVVPEKTVVVKVDQTDRNRLNIDWTMAVPKA